MNSESARENARGQARLGLERDTALEAKLKESDRHEQAKAQALKEQLPQTITLLQSVERKLKLDRSKNLDNDGEQAGWEYLARRFLHAIHPLTVKWAEEDVCTAICTCFKRLHNQAWMTYLSTEQLSRDLARGIQTAALVRLKAAPTDDHPAWVCWLINRGEKIRVPQDLCQSHDRQARLGRIALAIDPYCAEQQVSETFPGEPDGWVVNLAKLTEDNLAKAIQQFATKEDEIARETQTRIDKLLADDQLPAPAKIKDAPAEPDQHFAHLPTTAEAYGIDDTMPAGYFDVLDRTLPDVLAKIGVS